MKPQNSIQTTSSAQTVNEKKTQQLTPQQPFSPSKKSNRKGSNCSNQNSKKHNIKHNETEQTSSSSHSKIKQKLQSSASQTKQQSSTVTFSFQSQQKSQPQSHLQALPFRIHPKISVTAVYYQDLTKTKLQMYKEHLLNIRQRKLTIPKVPEPSVSECFQIMRQQKYIAHKKETLKSQIAACRKQYKKLNKIINTYKQAYDSKQQAIKEKILLSKILSSKLQNQLQKVREKFRELDFSKVINTSLKKLSFYQLAEVFFNNQARNIFSPQIQVKKGEQMGVYLGYLGFLIQHVALLAGVDMWIKFKFKGSRSTITVYDPKVMDTGNPNAMGFGGGSSLSNSGHNGHIKSSSSQSAFHIPSSTSASMSASGSGTCSGSGSPLLMYSSSLSLSSSFSSSSFHSSHQNNNLAQTTYVLNPKEPKLEQAIMCLHEQLRQIMKFNLHMHINKSNNFYELCEELSKFLMNV